MVCTSEEMVAGVVLVPVLGLLGLGVMVLAAFFPAQLGSGVAGRGLYLEDGVRDICP